jgi:YesN/AraC family two-component response regulator
MALWLYSLLPISQHGLTKNRQESIVEKFLQDAQDQYKQERRVGYYAQLQFITPKYLSMVVKLVTGKTVSDWINSFVILAAKSQLKNTIKTIQEIAVELNFPNQSFFGKYFKKNTGMSPSDYRSSN